MFNQNSNEEKKLDWMYKGPNSTVDREEYLLGRAVDKTLEQLNDEDKQKQQGIIAPPKNRVEHECIPPSIRDFNKLVQAEQVDLSTKLQEDPLVAIKKREEETRREFLQNPVQLKKLQKALKAQQAKKKKKKKKKSKDSSDSDSDLETKLKEKLLGGKSKKISKEERDLDTILIHKYEALKDKLTEDDLRDILNGKVTDTEDSTEENKGQRKSQNKRNSDDSDSCDNKRKKKHPTRGRKVYNKREDLKRNSSDNDSEISTSRNHNRNQHSDFRSGVQRQRSRSRSKSLKHRRYSSEKEDILRKKDKNYGRYNKKSDSHRYRSSSSDSGDNGRSRQRSRNYDSDDSDSKNRRVNYGLVSSDGKKIHLSKKDDKKTKVPVKPEKIAEAAPAFQKKTSKKLTEEEKEKLRQQMMENAKQRDKERERNVKKYREKEEQERKEQNFDPDFVHKHLLKSANTSSVESRIKANINNIQRSGRDMDRNFSRR